MLKFCLVNVLVVALLACPFKCMGGLSFATAPINVSTSGCACCQAACESSTTCEDNDGTTEKNEDRHSEDCRCTTCVCQGATLTSPGFEIDTNGAFAIAVVPYADLCSSVIALVLRGDFKTCSTHFSGSFVRISHRSLQI